ncbi:hypothetical protein [Candidatus Enterococcus willemsii]|uniref:Uncharacterized protein n=1 Tax=Candidatus Enterococcus willemsii TaxID=1857215 RepID=A0ABQ6Z2Z9_9ENTE|nr:hypothetical protein [Enterococcus sp. CU12B]KAF1306037.1 hypothetical protein BAU17_03470 [Enterococcus sp. CU12B]
MTEIFSFPDEPQRLWINGNKKMEEQEFLAAKEDFLQLYQLEPTFRHCRKVVSVLQMLGEFSAALDFAEDYFDHFLAEEAAFVEYVHLLLLDEQYLFAHRLLHQAPFETSQLVNELQQLEQMQEWMAVDHQQIKWQQLLRWDQSKSPIPQKAWHKWIKGMSLNNFFQLCQDYVALRKNPFILPKLIEELVRDGAQQSIQIDEQVIDLATLKDLDQMPIFQRIKQAVENQQLKDPQMKEMLLTEINAHFALMYPLLPPEVDAQKWADSYVLEYQSWFGDEVAQKELENYATIQAKKQQIREIYQGLL